jgi:hypothetical protein
MKKTVAILLFVLISMVSFSQDLYVSIDGASYKKMSAMYQTGITDTILVKNTNVILTFSIAASNGDQFSLNKGQGMNIIGTYTTGIKDTCKIPAFPTNYAIWRTGSSSLGQFKFVVIIKNPPIIINNSVNTNTIDFVIDSLKRLNYTLSSNSWTSIARGIYEYKIDQSPNIPSSGTSTVQNISNLSYPFTSSGTYYIHIRANNYYVNEAELQFGLSFAQWNTYSVTATYSAPTGTVTDVGIRENSISGFNVYPNPAKDNITVEYRSTNSYENVSIYNITGTLLYTERYETTGDNKLSFNLESYTPGIYFCRVGTGTYKFIKQ